jgi:SAM-dependent methyltransferase
VIDLAAISTGLTKGEEGIWYGPEHDAVSYPTDGNVASFLVEDRSFWFRHRNACIVAAVQALPPESGSTFFDIGGGNGFVAAGLVEAGFKVVLVEPGRKGAANAHRRGLEHVVCATTVSAGFRDGSLPAVGLFDVIEHVEDDLGFLRSMYGLLQQGGRLYATVPAYRSLWSTSDVRAGHFRRYTREGISGVLGQAGFKMEFASYIFRPLPLPTLLLRALPFRLGLARADGADQREPEKVSRDHRVEGSLRTRLLSAMLRPEVHNLAHGRVMRFGASCLVVARRSS